METTHNLIKLAAIVIKAIAIAVVLFLVTNEVMNLVVGAN